MTSAHDRSTGSIPRMIRPPGCTHFAAAPSIPSTHSAAMRSMSPASKAAYISSFAATTVARASLMCGGPCFGDPDCVDVASRVMHAYTPHSSSCTQCADCHGCIVALRRRARLATHCEQRPKEPLPRRAHKQRVPQRDELADVMQQRPVVLSILGEAQPGIKHNAVGCNSCRQCCVSPLRELGRHLENGTTWIHGLIVHVT